MKINLLAVFAVLGFVGVADAATSINMTNADGDTIVVKSGNGGYRSSRRTTTKRTTTKRAHMYDNLGGNTINGDVYVIGNDKVGKGDVKDAETVSTTTTTTKTKQTYVQGETYKKTAKRKYFIANPFYQPLKGQFGTVTTGEYMQGTFNFGQPGVPLDRKLTEWSIKEDLSFGITDKIALQGMAKYNTDKLVWKDLTNGETNEYKLESGINTYGIGVQGRIVDTDKWISTLSGYYQHQKHGVDYFIGDIKAGYKTGSSTIYGLARAWAISMESEMYGDYMPEFDDSKWNFMLYGNSNDVLFMGEGGLGVWTVLDEDWTLNVEGMYGFYDWHNQLSIKGAFGWQPNDYFALNLYAKTSLYDSANSKHLQIYDGALPFNHETWAASVASGYYDVELSKYKEWSVGLQVMFQF